MQVKIHNAYRIMVSICDSELIGKSFEEGIKMVEVRENFFKGEEKNEEEVLEIISDMAKEDATFNIVGERSVNAALKAGIISESGILRIDNVPVALVLL